MPEYFNATFKSHGECVAVYKANDDLVAYCKRYEATNPDEFYYYFKNIGECISTYRP